MLDHVQIYILRPCWPRGRNAKPLHDPRLELATLSTPTSSLFRPPAEDTVVMGHALFVAMQMRLETLGGHLNLSGV